MLRSAPRVRRALAVLAILGLALPSAAFAVTRGKPHRIARGYVTGLVALGDSYWVTFVDPWTTPGALRMRKLDADGRPLGPIRRFIGGESVAVNGSSMLLAGVSRPASDVFTGTLWVATVDADGFRGPRRPVAAWSGGGVHLAAWGDDGFALGYLERSTSLHVQRLDLSGEPVGSPRLALALPPLDEPTFPIGPDEIWVGSFALGAVGDRLFAAWEREGRYDPRHNFFYGPVGRHLDAEGGTGGPRVPLSREVSDEVPFGPRVAALDGEPFVAWTSRTGKVLLRRVDLESATAGELLVLDRRIFNYGVDLAADPAGGGLAVWSRSEPDAFRTVGRWLRDGAPEGPRFRVAPGAASAVATGPDGGALVVWTVYRPDGSPLLMGRRVGR